MIADTISRIEGLLSPIKWDSEGRVLEVNLLTFDEKSFSFSKTLRTNTLYKFTSKFIEVRGKINLRTQKILKIDEITEIKNEEEAC